jgi:hypothetical protein
MSTWILTEKLSKITAQARKIQSAKEINDFCSGPNVQFYSYFGSDCWLFGKMINLQNTCQDIAET